MTESQNQKRAYSPRYVMDQLNISRPTLNDWCKKGILKKIQIPGARRVYISKDSFDQIVK